MPLIFQEEEIKLLELFSSVQYFGRMRDKWEEMILHTESCLENHMSNLVSNYRFKALPDQPDIVWGHRVLPNFRHTLEQLNTAYILLAHGNSDALGYADNVRSDFRGQLDYIPDWMSEVDQKIYDNTLSRAVTMAHNISITEHAWWDRIDPHYHIEEFAEFPMLSSVCHYRVNKGVHVGSGEQIQVTGIYTPDMKDCCPQFLGSHHKAAPTSKMWVGTEDLIHPETGEKYGEQKIYKKVECTWYLVEKTDDRQTSDKYPNQAYQSLRVAAYETCPKTGFYFTPALPESRKRFIEGEVMPPVNSTYGQTIWQWDEHQ